MQAGSVGRGAIEFGLLGPLLARGPGGAVTLGSAKQRSLLAVLLLEARRDFVPAERLVDELWGEDPPPTAAKALQVHVSQLRRVLGPENSIVTRPGGYAIQIEGDLLDLHRFETLLGQARQLRAAGDIPGTLASLDAALELWRGPALADVTLLGVGAAEADRLDGLRAVAREDRLELELVLGGGAALVPELEALIASDPYRERLHALLMRALYRAGRQADALASFRRARTLLVEDLGLEPGPDLVRLEAAILAQDPTLDAPAAAATASTPGLVESLARDDAGRSILGREAELGAAFSLIQRPDVRLITVTGTGGIGKTRLMLEIAARLGDRSRVVELAAIAEPNRVVPAIAAATGAKGPSEDAIAAVLGQQPTVLCLDNFEQVLGAAPAIASLLSAVPSLTAVVTSRAPLRITGEHELSLAPLARDAAVELFVRRAREHNPRFSPGADERGAIIAVCERIDRLPLAIELAAARTTVLTAGEILERIGKRLDLLAAGRRDAPERHRTLRATIAWSHDLLAVEAQELFEQLAVFHSGWSLDAAEHVAGGWVVDSLSALVEHSLVIRDDSRFTMLETVRAYAMERLEASVNAPTVHRRHALWCVALAQAAEQELEGPEQERWFARMDAERENLRAAAAWGVANGEPEITLRLAGALWRFWLARGAVDILGMLSRALAAGDRDIAIRVRALNAAGVLAGETGDFSAAEASFDEALELAQQLADYRQMARALANLGLIATFAEDYATALDRYERVAAIWERLGDVRGQSVMRQNIGIVHDLTGDYEQALRLLEQSVELARATGDRIRLAAALGALGRVLVFHRLDDPRVGAVLREGFELSAAIGERVQTVELVELVAHLAACTRKPAVAAELIGAADAERERLAAERKPDEHPYFAQTAQELVRSLGREAYDERRERGRGHTLEAAVALASETVDRSLEPVQRTVSRVMRL